MALHVYRSFATISSPSDRLDHRKASVPALEALWNQFGNMLVPPLQSCFNNISTSDCPIPLGLRDKSFKLAPTTSGNIRLEVSTTNIKFLVMRAWYTLIFRLMSRRLTYSSPFVSPSMVSIFKKLIAGYGRPLARYIQLCFVRGCRESSRSLCNGIRVFHSRTK